MGRTRTRSQSIAHMRADTRSCARTTHLTQIHSIRCDAMRLCNLYIFFFPFQFHVYVYSPHNRLVEVDFSSVLRRLWNKPWGSVPVANVRMHGKQINTQRNATVLDFRVRQWCLLLSARCVRVCVSAVLFRSCSQLPSLFRLRSTLVFAAEMHSHACSAIERQTVTNVRLHVKRISNRTRKEQRKIDEMCARNDEIQRNRWRSCDCDCRCWRIPLFRMWGHK